MALPTQASFETELASIQTLIDDQLTAMAAGAADISYTLPTGVSVDRKGYLAYLMGLRNQTLEMMRRFVTPTMIASRGG